MSDIDRALAGSELADRVMRALREAGPAAATTDAPPPRRPELDDLLSDLAVAAGHYFRALIEQGLPEALAVRMAGDWHAAALAAEGRRMVETMTRRMARQSGRFSVGHQ